MLIMDDQDEIYDDVLNFQDDNMAGLRDIRSKFENQNANNKPLPMEKPRIPIGNKTIANRWDCGEKLKTTENNSCSESMENSVKLAKEVEKNQLSNRHESPNRPPDSSPRRDSKIGIPAIFKQAPVSSSPASSTKPKPTPKPLVSKETSDTNNNTRNIVQQQLAGHLAANVHKPVQRPFVPVRKAGLTAQSSSNDAPSSSARTAGTDDSNKPSLVSPATDKTPTRTGSVQAMASMLGGKIPANVSNLKAGLKSVSQQRSTVKPLSPRSEGVSLNSSEKAIELRTNQKLNASNKPLAPRKCVISLIRNRDGMKFHQIDVNTVKNCGVIPDKPKNLNICLDVEELAQEFDALLATLVGDGHGWQEVQEEYDDITIRPITDRTISLIEPMTENDEDQWKEAGFIGLAADGSSTEDQEVYDDAQSVVPVEDIDQDYEPLPDERDESPPRPGPKPSTEQPPPTPTDTQTEPHKQADPKEQEKEKKKKEKEEKKRQEQLDKELKQKQKDFQQVMKKYKISEEGLEATVGKGTVKSSKKAQKLDIAVTQGDRVEVVRMVDNQKGKWLIRITETEKVGYVDAANIEIMDGSFSEHHSVTPTSPLPPAQANGGNEEVYEYVDGEDAVEPTEDEIYEEI